MPTAVVVYRSATGTTRRLAEEIGAHLESRGITTTVQSVGDADPASLAGVDLVLLGCWTSGLFVVAQHPDEPWMAFVRELPDLGQARVGLFTTYKLATGSMFAKMRAAVGGQGDPDRPRAQVARRAPVRRRADWRSTGSSGWSSHVARPRSTRRRPSGASSPATGGASPTPTSTSSSARGSPPSRRSCPTARRRPPWSGATSTATYVRVNTMRGFQKERNMRRNPRVTLLCYDPRDDGRYLEVRGTVEEMTEDGAMAHLDALTLEVRRPADALLRRVRAGGPGRDRGPGALPHPADPRRGPRRRARPRGPGDDRARPARAASTSRCPTPTWTS